MCLDARAVQHCVAYGSVHIGRLESAGKFPKRIRLGPNRVAWSLREILDWMQSKVDARPVGSTSPKVVIEIGDRFILTKELRSIVLYTRQHIRNLEAAGKFPRRIWISGNRVVWLEREVTDWLEAQRKREEVAAAIKIYHVRLCRPRFEVADVTVGAENLESARQAALALAKTPKSGWRLLPNQPEIYRPHVATCIQDKSAKQGSHTVEDLLGSYHDSYVRYLMLYADIKAAEGTVLLQPWLTDKKPDDRVRGLMEHWMSDIEGYLGSFKSRTKR